MGFIKEFKEFAMRGNVLDMAVGVIIGGAFGKIVTSMVGDVLMPVISLATGGIDFTNLYINLSDDNKYNTLEEAQKAGASVFAYGQFLQNIIDFLIVAFCIFLLIKAINKLTNLRKKEEAAAAPEPPKGPTQEELLTEIRDLLKQK
ncbi:large conductance mechanosensitive channel protein MscL [Xylanibacter brevis]|uniref:large conductance mechanosensitive channel protein MscL n=1 Tax=Xylanibacter brevis TaxID=83231 RepID=UPI00048503F9|nr:large conductance mechanosensitive channel protein MscL [Xylanibacter brevis]